MALQLSKPLVVLDLETTGINVSNDRIVELALVKLHPDGKRETYEKRVNPEMEIPEASSAVHGIYNKDVALCPTFETLAPEIIEFIGDSDLGGFNSTQFDIPLLIQEFNRVNIDFEYQDKKLLDAKIIFHKMEQRTLSAAYQFYCNKTLENAHSALADTEATLEVLLAQTNHYEDLPQTADELHAFCEDPRKLDFAGRFIRNEQGVACFNFGKHKGKSVEEVFAKEPGYYSWMLNADFALDTKNALKKVKAEIDAKNA